MAKTKYNDHEKLKFEFYSLRNTNKRKNMSRNYTKK
jgi:hypothetical protein